MAFRWREVLAIVGSVTFLVGIMLWEVRDLRTRLRAVEITNTAQECAINPEICRAIRR